MTYSHLITAVLGAVVTALVYHLYVMPRGAQPLPGERAALAAPGRPGSIDPGPGRTPAPVLLAGVGQAGGDPGALDALRKDVRDRDEEIARLKDEIARLRAQGDDSRQQLEAVAGKPQSWPAGLPRGYNAEVFEARMQQFLERTQLGNLADIDCNEFPCIAVIETKAAGADFNDRLQAGMKDLLRGGDLGKRVATSIWGGQQQGDRRLTAIALAPAENYDGDLQRRASHRAQAVMENLRKGQP